MGRIAVLIPLSNLPSAQSFLLCPRAQDPSAPYAMPELQSAALLASTSMREVILTGVKGTLVTNSRVLYPSHLHHSPRCISLTSSRPHAPPFSPHQMPRTPPPCSRPSTAASSQTPSSSPASSPPPPLQVTRRRSPSSRPPCCSVGWSRAPRQQGCVRRKSAHHPCSTHRPSKKGSTVAGEW